MTFSPGTTAGSENADDDDDSENSQFSRARGIPALARSRRMMLMNPVPQVAVRRKSVCIIGTGALGSALACRFGSARYEVYLGSRNGRDAVPFYPALQYTNVYAGFPPDCIARSRIVILAIPPEAVISFLTPQAQYLAGKIVVDTSNPGVDSVTDSDVSMGEFVQQSLPASQVIKAFTLNSAFQLSLDRVASRNAPRVVALCGSDARSKRKFCDTLVDVGLVPLDLGGIEEARSMETAPLHFFSQWKIPSRVAASIFANAAIYSVVRDYVLGSAVYSRAHLPLQVTAVSSAWTASWLLAATYLPGLMATRIHSRPLPRWFVAWLDMRKQLGILCFVASCSHAMCLLFALQTTEPRYDSLLEQRGSRIGLNAWTHGGCLVGILAFFALSWVLSVSFVGGNLSWREWTFVQRTVGWLSVWLTLIHVALFLPARRHWETTRWPRGLPPTTAFDLAPLLVCCMFKAFDASRRSVCVYRRRWALSRAAHVPRRDRDAPPSPQPPAFDGSRLDVTSSLGGSKNIRNGGRAVTLVESPYNTP